MGNGMSGVMVATMIKSICSAVTPRPVHGAQGGLGGQVGGEFVLGGDAALLDAGAGGDPFVGGVHHFLQVGVGQDFGRHIGADASDGAGAALEIILGARVFEFFGGWMGSCCGQAVRNSWRHPRRRQRVRWRGRFPAR